MRNEGPTFEAEFRDTKDIYSGVGAIPLNMYDKEALLLVNKVFTSNKFLALTIVKAETDFKVVRSRRSYFFQKIEDAQLSDAMASYEKYLDLLFVSGIEEAYTSEFNLDTIQLMIETLVSYFDVEIAQNNDDRVVRICDTMNANIAGNHALFFRPEDIRTSFNADFLKGVQRQMTKDALPENSKNKVGIEHVAMSLKNNPRPKMKVLEYDPFIMGTGD